MKEITKTKHVEYEVYVCEVCGEESEDFGLIARCEGLHKEEDKKEACKMAGHVRNIKSVAVEDIDYTERLVFKRECKCGEEEESWSFDRGYNKIPAKLNTLLVDTVFIYMGDKKDENEDGVVLKSDG